MSKRKPSKTSWIVPDKSPDGTGVIIEPGGPPPWLPSKEAAKVLGVTQARIRQLILERQLPAVKMGRDWLIRREDIASFERRPVGRPRLHKEDNE